MTYPHPHERGAHDRYGSPWRPDPTHQGTVSDSMRVSDAERSEVTNALCRHFGDGRLDEAELNDRLARATAARTRGDLAPLLADLPRLDAARPVASSHHPPRRRGWLALALLVVVTFGWSLAGAVAHLAHFPLRVPWLLIAVLAVVVLRRGRPRRHHHRF